MAAVPSPRNSRLEDFQSIDWQRPWLAPYRERGQRLVARLAEDIDVASALNAESDRPELPAGRLYFGAPETFGEAYEALIARTACVPTRRNLHDFFNGLVWLTFPGLKRRLNALQAAEIARLGVGASRGALRDALTLLDENGLLWVEPAPGLAAALQAQDWPALFQRHRDAWADARLIVFGHALMEKLLLPRKPITAHTWVLPDAQALSGAGEWPGPELLASRAHRPLPVLGVPGWWPANEDPGFYADAAVFRSPRR